jgi:hypothetical protein
MTGIRIDPDARTARAQAGVLLGEMDRESQAFGHAVPAGIVTHTGLAGLTLGRAHNRIILHVRCTHSRGPAVRRAHSEWSTVVA